MISSRNRLALSAIAAAFCALTAPVAADEFFVNGQTGTDIPGNGRSATTPWKTIRYALTQIPRPTDPRYDHVLYVEGNQEYSPTTNGESFPIRAAYNVSIIGTFVGHGRMPVLRIPAGSSGIWFDPNEVFNRNQVTIRYLVFDGGQYGAEMGAAPGQRHRPKFDHSLIRGQTIAGIKIDTRGGAIEDPRFFDVTFERCTQGILGLASGGNTVLYPDIDQCTFRDLSGAGVSIRDSSGLGSNVGGLYRESWFLRCQRGIRLETARGAVATNADVRSCHFRECSDSGLHIFINQPADPAVRVENCGFVQCGSGIKMDGLMLPGPYTLTARNCVMQDCTTGLLVGNLTGSGTLRIDLIDSLLQRNSTGMECGVLSPGIQYLMQVLRTRMLRNGRGLRDRGTGGQGQLRVESSMFCGNSSDGAYVDGTGELSIVCSTFADNRAGLSITRAGKRTLEHLLFAGNTTHVSLLPGIGVTYSCFEKGGLAGQGNVFPNDAGLLRPSYHLAPHSPCIDAGNVAAALPATDYEGDPRSSISKTGGQPLPDLGADEHLLAGSVHAYGVPGFGRLKFFPEIASPTTSPRIGQTLSVDLKNAKNEFGTRAAAAGLFLAMREAPSPLPFDLHDVGAGGSYLWCDLAFGLTTVGVDANGGASLSFGIPGMSELVGQTVLFQWLLAMRDANAIGLVTTQGLRVTFGR
jgi:hypothetical protein